MTLVEALRGLCGPMGSVLITGRGDHLPPMKTDSMSVFIPDTQADVLRQEVVVELMDNETGVWTSAAESGYTSEPPPEGKMLKVRISGQATVFVDHTGKVCVDNFSS